MKLNLESLRHNISWKSYRLPQYDVEAAREATRQAPTWLHFGAGNLFRAFPAVLAQRLLTAGLSSTGVICCEGNDEELIDRCYRACDHLSVSVTLYPNGSFNKEVVASVTESLKLSEDTQRLLEIFRAPSLQMVSFTITEKGYGLRDDLYHFLPEVEADMQAGPENAATFFGRVAALCLARQRAGLPPIALVSLDNCQNNGHLLCRAVGDMADAWKKNGFLSEPEYDFLTRRLTFPRSMIDKITPRPDERVTQALLADGLEDVRPFITKKNTYASIFVNAERPQYLLIEDAFPNGHPPLGQLGVILTSRSIVERSSVMKVCTCMNPMDTALGIFGCLLGYSSISAEMQDRELVTLITRMSETEAMPMVTDPGVIDPVQFLHEVLGERYPNPFLPDTPQRIATDTGSKLAIRFGVTLRAYYNSSNPMHQATKLTYIPLVLAGWLRYLLEVDDEGKPFPLSPDDSAAGARAALAGIQLGDKVPEPALYALLTSKNYFGCNLFEVGVGETVVELFNELIAGPGAVRATLQKYCGAKK